MTAQRSLRALVALVAAAAFAVSAQPYQPNWASLDSRPLPAWYDSAKIGIFIHWGVFSVPAFGVGDGAEWFWQDWQGAQLQPFVDFVAATEAPGFAYPEYAPRFDATFFNATAWAELFAASGARYVVPTAKHHEGWCNWPSSTAFNWNSVSQGPKRDLIGELSTAIKGAGLHLGLYHSLYEWFNPLYLADKAANWSTNAFVTGKTMPELYDLVNRYEPELVWSDGDWEAPDSYWNSTAFLAWLVNESPVKDTVVYNDRWGIGDMCHHGSYITCADRFLPSSKQGRKFENAMTIDTISWGYRRNAQLGDYLTVPQIIATLVQTVALGGNLLVNVGPAADGNIDSIFQDRLMGMGAWLGVNGEAIYGSTPWRVQNETAAAVWYTEGTQAGGTSGNVYAIATQWPANNSLLLAEPVPTAGTTATLVGYRGAGAALSWTAVNGVGKPGIRITLPALSPADALSSFSAWSVKLTQVQ